MLNLKRNILAGASLAALACAAGADAQETPQGNSVVGPPQLRDFRLPGERRTAPVQPPADEPIIQPPRQQNPPPATPRLTPALPPATQAQPERSPDPRPQPRAATPQQPRTRGATPAPVEGPAMTPAPAPVPNDAAPQPLPQQLPAPAPGAGPASLPLPAEAPSQTPSSEQGYPFWLYLVPAGLALLAAVAWRRRRRAAQVAAAEPELEPVAAPPPAPLRPAPQPRPWIELEFKPERAAATLTEANVQFELVVRNTGGSAARNIRIEARMFNAGREQDKEIGAFFRRPAAEVTTSTLPALEAESETSFRSVVTMPREAMRAVTVQGRALFVPMVAFNVFYEWSGNRRGQTSRSYVVGREPAADQRAERMAPFRLDLGPRIYRTVGQREHSLARRV
jgi:hypothetical protein